MRKLASVQRITKLSPIKGADRIETAQILGWQVVVKKDEFKVNDLCVYFEIDSLLPELPVFEFLRSSCYSPKLKRFRLKTIRLRKQISQGLALPLKSFISPTTTEGADLTELLNIEKYEPPVTSGGTNLTGKERNFEWPISKTDETRIQNNPGIVEELKGKPYYITCKLDGTSASYILKKNILGILEFHVCGRNISIKNKGKFSWFIDNVVRFFKGKKRYKYKENVYWKIAKKYNIEEFLRIQYKENGLLLSIQGEIVGPGIQGNKLGLKDHDFYMFNMWNEDVKSEFWWMRNIGVGSGNFKMVPIIDQGPTFDYTTQDLFKMSEDKYKKYFDTADEKQEMEGIVVRSKDQSISFKVINNKFLLKGGD